MDSIYSYPFCPWFMSDRYKKEVNDEMEITNLRKCDSICFKITTALIVGIGFLSAILRFKISSEIIGYMLMGGLF